MCMVLTEEQAVYIRSTGISVIEFKNIMRKFEKALRHSIYQLVEIAFKALRIACEVISNAVDAVLLTCEDVRFNCGYPTGRRYAFVKNLSKFGYDKREIWRMTRHIWLARSDC